MSSSVVPLSSSPDVIDDCGSSTILNRRASDASNISSRLRRNSLDPEARERQRTMDVDMAMQLSRARRETVAGSPEASNMVSHPAVVEEEEHLNTDHSAVHLYTDDEAGALPDNSSRIDLNMLIDHAHDPSLITHAATTVREPTNESLFGLPTYQANLSRSEFDFSPMEEFAAAEKATLDLSPTTKFSLDALRPPRRPTLPPTERSQSEAGPSVLTPRSPAFESQGGHQSEDVPRPSLSGARQRKLSLSNPHPRTHRKGLAGKMALFEAPHESSTSGVAAIPSRISVGLGRPQPNMYDPVLPQPSLGGILTTGHDRPYRFSFYSNALAATIHARSLSELPADGQTFEQLFSGINLDSGAYGNGGSDQPAHGGLGVPGASPNNFGGMKGTHRMSNLEPKGPTGGHGDSDDQTWWLDVTSPTDEEMKMLSKVFGIHPLTSEDIQMEETREKIELFQNYYLVCFRSFDQDQYSPTYLEPLNMYIIVFREGILSFHFRPTPHPQNVRRRIKQLKDYIAVTSDWISYALIDDITDAFGPLIQGIEYEVDSIDELVLILKEAEQSDMLRRIGTCRKKVMGLLRLMGNKADVVKGLAKRCNENWRVAPTSDIGLYLSDIQDHLITMTQNLNHYEKILSRSHSNYLAQISIEMTDANNQINNVLSKLTALGTVLIPMNLVTGIWGMNVHVPGEGIPGYGWFAAIVSCLAAFAVIGGYSTYRYMVSRNG